jgi:transposase InsO family protein
MTTTVTTTPPTSASAPGQLVTPPPAVDTSPTTGIVYGYLRPSAGSCPATDRADIRHYAADRGWQVADIFADTTAHTTPAASRPAFTQLLSAARDPRTRAVIVPGRRHLSVDTFVLDVLIRAIRATGCPMLVISDGDWPNPDNIDLPSRPVLRREGIA